MLAITVGMGGSAIFLNTRDVSCPHVQALSEEARFATNNQNLLMFFTHFKTSKPIVCNINNNMRNLKMKFLTTGQLVT